MLFRENNFRYHLHSLQAIGRGAPPPREQSPALGRASPCTLTVSGGLISVFYGDGDSDQFHGNLSASSAKTEPAKRTSGDGGNGV